MQKTELIEALTGLWVNSREDIGWNVVALPDNPQSPNYRLMVNRYSEELFIKPLTSGVINRGMSSSGTLFEQTIIPLAYEQTIKEISSSPQGADMNARIYGEVIHEELGMFLFSTDNEQEESVRHAVTKSAITSRGNALIAPGHARTIPERPRIELKAKLPTNFPGNPNAYHAPYYQNLNPDFTPVIPEHTLKVSNDAFFQTNTNIKDVTTFTFQAPSGGGGIISLPFLAQHAPVTEFESIFWLYRMRRDGKMKYRLQYSQTSILEFGDSGDGRGGKIRWPHVSVNTLEKVQHPTST